MSTCTEAQECNKSDERCEFAEKWLSHSDAPENKRSEADVFGNGRSSPTNQALTPGSASYCFHNFIV